MSLLECAYGKCRELDMNNSWERDVYEKIVFRAREKIRRALRKNMTEIILKSIYLMKKEGIPSTVSIILGSLYDYKKSLWRLSLIHALANYLFSQTFNERKLSIITTCHVYFPYSGCIEEKEKIIDLTSELDSESEFPQYLEIYLSFGKNLLPNI
jgi:hypothetical protein